MGDGWITRTPSGRVVEHRPYFSANCSNNWVDPQAGKRVTLHTTESDPGSFDGVMALWDSAERRGFKTVPTFTVDWKAGRVAQHSSMFGSCCALEGCSSGLQTNGVPNVQVELCGRADSTQDWPDSALAFIADWLGGVRAGGFDVLLSCSVPFYGQDAGFTLASYNAKQRLGPNAWREYQGLLGHQHVPCNAHWDPGKLNVARIIQLAGGSGTATGGLTMSEVTEINAHTDAVIASLRATLGQDEQDTRAYEGLAPLQVPGDPKQYIVVWMGNGWAKRWIRDQIERSVLTKQGTIQRAAPEFAAQAVTLHGAEAEWLTTLVEV